MTWGQQFIWFKILYPPFSQNFGKVEISLQAAVLGAYNALSKYNVICNFRWNTVHPFVSQLPSVTKYISDITKQICVESDIVVADNNEQNDKFSKFNALCWKSILVGIRICQKYVGVGEALRRQRLVGGGGGGEQGKQLMTNERKKYFDWGKDKASHGGGGGVANAPMPPMLKIMFPWWSVPTVLGWKMEVN